MDKKVKSQLLSVRSTALTNMFDLAAVSRIAKVLGYKELVDFIKKAFVLAIFKFVMELCAQIVQSLVQAMVNKNQKPVEISTQGVFFTVPGQQAPQQTPTTGTNQNRSSFDNPFGDVFNSGGRSW